MSLKTMGLKAENVLDEIQLEYAGLSVEEVEIMRLFEGERGKKVVHKVCNIDLRHSSSTLFQSIKLGRSTDD